MSDSSEFLNVLIVLGDIGCTNDLILTIKKLEELGHNVYVSLDSEGRGGQALLDKGIYYGSFVKKWIMAVCDVVLVGTSATAYGSQKTATALAQDYGVPCVWFEDLHGTSNAVSDVDPDMMLVVDNMAENMVRRVRPGLPTTVVGKPSFTPYKEAFDKRKEWFKREVLTSYSLKLGHSDLVLTYCSGGESRERVEKHLHALSSLPSHVGSNPEDIRRLVVIPRIHPKLPGRDDIVARMSFGEAHVVRADDESFIDLHAVTDVFLGDWGSTDGIISALLGNLTMITLFPDDVERRVDRGHENGLFPLLRAHCCCAVMDGDDLGAQIEAAWLDDFALVERTRRARTIFGGLLKGVATQNIVEAVLNAVKS